MDRQNASLAGGNFDPLRSFFSTYAVSFDSFENAVRFLSVPVLPQPRLRVDFPHIPAAGLRLRKTLAPATTDRMFEERRRDENPLG